MTVVDSESITEEYDDEFDLDVRIDDIDPGEPDRIHLASFAMSCSMCCPGEDGPTRWSACRTYRGCTEYSECFCTGKPC